MKKFKESQIIQDSLSLSPRLVYQIIRIEGEEELARPLRSLIWAGIAAGMLISFSVLGEAILRTHLPDTPSRYVFENFGYSFGFLLVILGRLQLFTENTITTVFPFGVRTNAAHVSKRHAPLGNRSKCKRRGRFCSGRAVRLHPSHSS